MCQNCAKYFHRLSLWVIKTHLQRTCVEWSQGGLAAKKEVWLWRMKGLGKTALTVSCQANAVPLHSISQYFTMQMGYKCRLLGLNRELDENFCKSLQLMLCHGATWKAVNWNWRDIFTKMMRISTDRKRVMKSRWDEIKAKMAKNQNNDLASVRSHTNVEEGKHHSARMWCIFCFTILSGVYYMVSGNIWRIFWGWD